MIHLKRFLIGLGTLAVGVAFVLLLSSYWEYVVLFFACALVLFMCYLTGERIIELIKEDNETSKD
jgi:membrane protein implicated in regulation of membrane protease activity